MQFSSHYDSKLVIGAIRALIRLATNQSLEWALASYRSSHALSWSLLQPLPKRRPAKQQDDQKEPIVDFVSFTHLNTFKWTHIF